MRLADMTDIAFRILILAGSTPDQLLRIDTIIAVYDLPRGTVKKVVTGLTQSGFLTAQRGRSGGLLLARPPVEINLGQVTRTVEPDFGLVECMRKGNTCAITAPCKLKSPLRAAQQAFLATLDDYTLADILLEPRHFPSLEG